MHIAQVHRKFTNRSFLRLYFVLRGEKAVNNCSDSAVHYVMVVKSGIKRRGMVTYAARMRNILLANQLDTGLSQLDNDIFWFVFCNVCC